MEWQDPFLSLCFLSLCLFREWRRLAEEDEGAGVSDAFVGGVAGGEGCILTIIKCFFFFVNEKKEEEDGEKRGDG